MKKDTFLKGAVILGAAGMIVKVMGAFFRIPLGYIIESEGMGYYQVGYTVYNFLLAFTAAGFPTAISKLVSEKRARADYQGAHKVFKTSFYLLLALGTVGSVALALLTTFLVNNVFESPNAYYAVVALAPAVFFVAALAAFRGYFQGMKDMMPTAVSQVIEQAARVLFGFSLAYIFLRRFGVIYAAGGAAFGASIGAASALGMMAFLYKKRENNILPLEGQAIDAEEETSQQIIKRLLRIAIPIAIGAAVMPLINMIDTFIVLRRLQATGFSYQEANSLYGQLQGMAAALVNLPQVLTLALATSIVPVISESAAQNDWDSARQDIRSALRVALLIGLPASAGLAVLSTPIMAMLYPREPATIGRILLFLAFAVTFLAPLQALTGVLQGLGKPDIPVRNLMVGAGFKFITTYVLTGIPALNVKGAAIGTVIAYFVAFLLNFIAVKKETKVAFEPKQFIIKPVLSVTVMGAVVFILYRQLYNFLGNSLSTVISIAIGAAVYGVMLLKTKTIIEEDFDLLPGGSKLLKLLRKLKLMH
ncbi:putative polysaccharide biosynthesis protein [Clostridium formicaceticum]|uniref:Stage V sporulation protein B n=1 Tax=Clostridium formicaceticum TaxID=1497 RepID=A0AAC9WFE0_9CLOT|nr:polysaccharide biosynthesis protein [Clostridium formicaceticum]AOY75509.1 stage V sporulation protein B [Clostridium formicaceticum]ARE85800.1 Stage V sporulation protein B [Clostridium formicaceticum]